jgi:hypothetical protein
MARPVAAREQQATAGKHLPHHHLTQEETLALAELPYLITSRGMSRRARYQGVAYANMFDSHGNFFYAMSKASWALFLVALFFGVLAFFSAILAPCSRLISFLASFMASIAMIIQAAACAVMT